MEQSGSDSAAGKRPDTPRWVKALALAGAVVVLVVVVVMLASGGEHGPGRHGGWIETVEASFSALLA